MAELGLAPCFENDLEVFFEPVAQLFERRAESERLVFDETVTDAELEPAVAQAV